MRQLAVGAAALAAALAVAAAPADSSSAGATATVRLQHIAFTPATVRIRVGQRVRWSWQDPYVLHNLHATGSPRFPGASARKSGTYTVRFTRPGTYRYACTLHPGMAGRVVVRR